MAWPSPLRYRFIPRCSAIPAFSRRRGPSGCSSDLTGNGDKAALIAETLVVLPDAPSDLELRIDDGPPVWRSNGAVRLEPGTDLSLDGFNQNGQRLVDLTAALAALTGNPVAPVGQDAFAWS